MKKSIALIAVAAALALPGSLAFAETSPADPIAGSTSAAGAPASETSDRTPEKKSPTPSSQMDPAGGATSDRTPKDSRAAGEGPADLKLTQAQCETLWKQADSSGAGTLSQSQAQPYVGDFKSLDGDANGKLSGAEFLKGCEGGMVKGGASTGAGTGTSGSTTAPKN